MYISAMVGSWSVIPNLWPRNIHKPLGNMGNMDQPVTHHNSTAVSGWAAASVALAVLCGVHAEVVLEALQRDAA